MRLSFIGLSFLLLVFLGLMSGYFFWKHTVLYLPNKADIDMCVTSGGSCSVDGFGNLETSLILALIFMFAAFFFFFFMVGLFNWQSRYSKIV